MRKKQNLGQILIGLRFYKLLAAAHCLLFDKSVNIEKIIFICWKYLHLLANFVEKKSNHKIYLLNVNIQYKPVVFMLAHANIMIINH